MLSMEEYVASRNFVHRRDPYVCDVKILSTKQHPTWVEEHAVWSMEGNPDTPMDSAYALDGSYIGTVSDGKFFEKKGIVPERSAPDHKVASIGFEPATGKWWGWSHRARTNFDTKGEAIQFAESVSHVQETGMYKSVKRLLTAAEDPDVDPESAKHELSSLGPSVRTALRLLVGVSADIEDYGAPSVPSLKIRDGDPTFDFYVLLNMGGEGSFFLPQPQNASSVRRAQTLISAAARRIEDLEFVGIYARPHNQTQLELGARFMWSGNDG